MNRLWKFSLLLLLPVFLLVAPVRVAAAPQVSEISTQLICQCGCLTILDSCSHGECGGRDTMLGIIKLKISQGQTAEQIVASFVAQYGEKVLAEPPKKGFNLTAWLFPFVSLAAGALVVYLAIKRWLKRRTLVPDAIVGSDEEEASYRRRLEQELEEFPERGFR